MQHQRRWPGIGCRIGLAGPRTEPGMAVGAAMVMSRSPGCLMLGRTDYRYDGKNEIGSGKKAGETDEACVPGVHCNRLCSR